MAPRATHPQKCWPSEPSKLESWSGRLRRNVCQQKLQFLRGTQILKPRSLRDDRWGMDSIASPPISGQTENGLLLDLHGFTEGYRRLFIHIILWIYSIFLSLSQKIGNMSGDWNALECASAIAAALSWTRPPQIWSKSGNRNDACFFLFLQGHMSNSAWHMSIFHSARRNPL